MNKYFIILLLIFSCTTLPEDVKGCLDPNACNFISNANVDDGSCGVFDCDSVCGGTAYVDQCGFCDDDTENDCLQDCSDILSELTIGIDGFDCSGNVNELGYNCDDLEVILNIMYSNPQSLHRGMDKDSNQVITVYEFGEKNWFNSRLTSLDLSYNQNVIIPSSCNFRLTSLPHNIGELDALTMLSIKDNEINSIPENIGQLVNLTELILESNLLTSLPESVSSLTLLEKLYVHHNLLTELPDGFTELSNLKKAWLHYNQIEFLPENIGNLSQLQELWLHHNALLEIPESIGNLGELESLKLEYNQLISLPNSICNLSTDFTGGLLLNLSISNNKSCPVYPVCVDKILGYQDCTECESGFLIGDGSAGEEGKNSECLAIQDWMAIQDIIDANDAYSGLKPNEIVHHSHWIRSDDFNRLSELRLEHESLNGILPKSIGDLDSLKNLIMTGNKMTGEIPESLGNLTELIDLKLNSNQFGCFIYDDINNICLELCDDSNGCSGAIPNSLSNLTKLEKFIGM